MSSIAATITPELIQESLNYTQYRSLIDKLLAQGKTYRQITSMTGISKSTLIRAKQHI